MKVNLGMYQELKIFFGEQRALGKPISGSLLQEKARILPERLTNQSQAREMVVTVDNTLDSLKYVKMSDGFINKFKERHGIIERWCRYNVSQTLLS